jgi:hypothetical protein
MGFFFVLNFLSMLAYAGGPVCFSTTVEGNLTCSAVKSKQECQATQGCQWGSKRPATLPPVTHAIYSLTHVTNRHIYSLPECIPETGQINELAKLLEVVTPPAPVLPTLSDKIATRSREAFDKTGECPKNLEDIRALKNLAKAAMKNGEHKKVDLSPLFVGSKEPKFGIACGYRFDIKTWYSNGFHCKDATQCFEQYPEVSEAQDCAKIVPVKGEPGVWKLENDCQGNKSHRDGGDQYDTVFVPLGQGVYIYLYTGPKDGIVYTGLVIAPRADKKK